MRLSALKPTPTLSNSSPLLSTQLLPASHPPRLPRCSLRLVFVLCTIVQVSIACVCVWYIGYASQLMTVSTLSGQLRNQTISHMVDQVASQLSGPILAVNEVDLNTQQRMLSTGWGGAGDPYAALDWSTDVSYYTAMANIIRHYPGVTATAMQTSATVLMTAVLAFNDKDANATPPQLGFINQDVQTGWSWDYWPSSYNQTLFRMSLLNSIDILSTTANWFDILPAGDLAKGRAHPLFKLGYVDPSWNNWYVLANRTARKAIRENNTAVMNVGWSIPIYAVNHNTASVTETLSICKPHINMSPNVTWMRAVAEAANATGCPRAPYLLAQAASQQERVDSGLPPFPVIDWVSDVTFDPYALVVFMKSRLSSFVLDNGAAFICTTDGWILASTLPGPDLSVLVYMPELLHPTTPDFLSYSQNVTSAHPVAMEFVRSLSDNMQSDTWQHNINNVTLSDASNGYQVDWEQSETINGARSYVQYAVLGVPASGFSFVLVVYSRQSDYEGGLVHNAQLSGVLSAVVIAVSIIATLLLTQCVNRPILTLISAMKAVLGDNPWQKSPAANTSTSRQPGRSNKASQRTSFAESTYPPNNGQHPPPLSIQYNKPSPPNDSQSPLSQHSPSSPVTDQLSSLPVALPSPSHLHGKGVSSEVTLLEHDFLRTSSCSTMTGDGGMAASPHASKIARTLVTQANDSSSSSPFIPNKSLAGWQPIEAQPPVYTKYVPATDPSLARKTSGENTLAAEQAVSITIVSPPAVSAVTTTTVHYPMSISTDEESQHGNRQSRSQADDSSSYELDLLLQKWQRTMLAQGVRLPAEWETDLQEDAQRLRELRMGLREARKRYQGKRRRARAAQVDESGGVVAVGSDDEDDEDDKSVFTPNDGKLSALSKLSLYVKRRIGRADFSSPPEASSNGSEPSVSHQSISSNSTNSTHSSHPSACHCSACQLSRFTHRLFGCAGNFSEVVQLQLTFGAMLFRLRNSALKLEKANQSKGKFLRSEQIQNHADISSTVRVPLNALGLGVDQLYEIVMSEKDKREAHALHLTKQQDVLSQMEDELHVQQCSTHTLASLLMQLDQLRFDCALCAATSSVHTPPQLNRLSSASHLLPAESSSSSSSSSSDATSIALLHIVQDQVATVTRILNDVLSFQRIEDGELKLEMAPFNVCVMVDNTLHSFQAEFRQKQLKVKMEYRHHGKERELKMPVAGGTEPVVNGVKTADVRLDIDRHGGAPGGLAADSVEGVELQTITPPADTALSPLSWYVSADQYRLRQVLSNFISNAVKFVREGGAITVVATLTPSHTDAARYPPTKHHFLELAVRDSGIGISPAGLRSLFQAYSQIRPGALQEGKGSGLGLSICKKLVELHGGRVVVSSTPGEGSTFSLVVPVDVMRESEVREMLKQQGGSSRSHEALASSEETEGDEDEDKDEEESKQVEGMDEETLRHGLYRYQPRAGEADAETAANSLNVMVPPMTPPTGSPNAADEGVAQRATSEPTISAVTSPVAFTPTTVRELASESTAETATLSPPPAATITTITTTASQSVRLPTRRLLAASAKPLASNTPPGLGSGAGGRRKLPSSERKPGEEVLRALVVEDSAVNRKLLVMMTEKMGLAVESAEDGQHAYEMVSNYVKAQQQALLAKPATTPTDSTPTSSVDDTSATSNPAPSPTSPLSPAGGATPVTCQYDVIFMDDHMPRLTGVQCVAQLRALGVTIPIFGITANALLEDQQRFVKAGVTAVVTKPMQKKQLVDMIATARRIKEEQRKNMQQGQEAGS